jgi:hypothetical protein
METYTIPAHTKGDTFDGLEFEVLINSVAKDFTDTDITCQFRLGSKTGEVKKSLSVGSGFTKTDPTNGKFTMDAFDVDFDAGVYYYDVQFDDAGVIKTYFGGTWTINQDVTDNG